MYVVQCDRCEQQREQGVMCACDTAHDQQLRKRQIDSHPEPGGRHVFVDCVCACGLHVDDRELVEAPFAVLRHRRYWGDRVEWTVAAGEEGP